MNKKIYIIRLNDIVEQHWRYLYEKRYGFYLSGALFAVRINFIHIIKLY